MKTLLRRRDDSGATLLLVLGFTLMIGSIMGALIPFITTSFSARVSLDIIRNRQYAADLVVEESIAKVRALAEPAVQVCGPYNRTITNGSQTVNVHVDCINKLDFVLAGTTLVDQRNVLFIACEGTSNTNSFCTSATSIVRAQVNFEVPTGSAVTRTYIQAWSVNR